MIDSHCHLTYPQLASQLDAVLTRASAAGVEKMITIGTSARDAHHAVDLCKQHAHIRCAIGVHPHHAADASDDEFLVLNQLERENVVVALGEMGLDYHYDFSPRDRQKEVFSRQMQHARQRSRPVVIHCREAMDDCLALMKDFPEVPAVFHCFTGTAAEARRVLDAGYLIGFTGVVTFKRSDELREVARFVPADRLLIETDAPYLAPEPHRNQRINEPSLVIYTAQAVADARGLSLAEIGRLTTENTIRFFRW